MNTETPSIISPQSPPRIDEAQFNAMKSEIENGDQSWRSTIAERWAQYWERRANRMAHVISCNEKMASNPLCDAISAAEFRALNISLKAKRDQELKMAKDIRSGDAVFDPVQAELILRFI